MIQKTISTMLIVFFLLGGIPAASAQSSTLDVKIAGVVVDNYANMTYIISIPSDTEDLPLLFPRSNGLFLSNISIVTSNFTLWGRIEEVSEAKEIYNETVEQKVVGALVLIYSDRFQINVNNPTSESIVINVFFEGYLQRNRGSYVLNLLRDDFVSYPINLNVDLRIKSSSVDLIGFKVDGKATGNLVEGDREYHYTVADQVILDQERLSITYITQKYSVGAELLTYGNGTTNVFAYYLAPVIETSGGTVKRQIVFTIDVSGSMSGERINQAKGALLSILDTLGENDKFNIVAYESSVKKFKNELVTATSATIGEAKTYVSSLQADGGTNFHGGVKESLLQFFNSTDQKLMIVLSDGEPTAGEITDPNEIRTFVKENNPLKVSISTVAMGDADVELMKGIALDNNGVYVRAETDQEAKDAILALFDQVTVPTINSILISFAGEVLQKNMNLRDDYTKLTNGSEIVITGLYQSSVTISVDFFVEDTKHHVDKSAGTGDLNQKHVLKLWVLQKIMSLVRQYESDPNPTIKAEIVSTAKTYGILVPEFTAIILTALEEIKETTTGSMLVSSQLQSYIQSSAATVVNEVASSVVQEAALPYNFLIFAVALIGIPVVIRKRRA